MNDQVQFVIESGVALPPRTIPNAGPRESMYPVDKLQKGEAFAVRLGTYAEDGTFTPHAAGSEEAGKQARQKQSQFSSLARSRNISLVTRYFSGDGEANQSPFTNTPAPCLGIWHDGEAKPKKERKSKKADAAAPAAPAAESNAAAAGEASASGDTLTL